MQIAVVGASGKTGSAVAELALENGHDLRAVIVSGPRNRPFDLVGPEALTFPQMANELGRAMKSEVRFTTISDDVFIEHVGAAIGSTKIAAAIAGAYRAWECDGSGTGDASVLEREFDVSLIRFQDYAANLVEAWKHENSI